MAQYHVKREPGYMGLTMAIVALAVKDAHRGNGYAGDAIEFLRSDWGEMLAAALDLDITIRDWLRSPELGERTMITINGAQTKLDELLEQQRQLREQIGQHGRDLALARSDPTNPEAAGRVPGLASAIDALERQADDVQTAIAKQRERVSWLERDVAKMRADLEQRRQFNARYGAGLPHLSEAVKNLRQAQRAMRGWPPGVEYGNMVNLLAGLERQLQQSQRDGDALEARLASFVGES